MKKLLANNAGKAIVGLIAAAILLLALSSIAGAARADDRITSTMPKFSDVPDGHWAKLHIMRLTSEEAITGYPDGIQAEQ
jgi:hypothetical protein